MMDHCPWACSGGECPDPAGNEMCQDDDLNCPGYKEEVINIKYLYVISICYVLSTG